MYFFCTNTLHEYYRYLTASYIALISAAILVEILLISNFKNSKRGQAESNHKTNWAYGKAGTNTITYAGNFIYFYGENNNSQVILVESQA